MNEKAVLIVTLSIFLQFQYFRIFMDDKCIKYLKRLTIWITEIFPTLNKTRGEFRIFVKGLGQKWHDIRLVSHSPHTPVELGT